MIKSIERANSDSIADLIIKTGKPDDTSTNIIQSLSGVSLGANSDVFAGLLEELTCKVTKAPQKLTIEKHRRCLRHTLHSLISCIFRFEQLTMPTNPPNFIKGARLQLLGFSQTRMKSVIDLLQEEGLILLGRKGHLDPRPGKPNMSAQYYPTEKFIRLFSDSLYSFCGDFDSYQPYKFERFADEDLPAKEDIEGKVQTIKDYNAFMREHTFAMKTPSTRSIKDFIGRSGRINNYFQSLANRRIKIRTRTLLDGEAIAEPDFSCNHLRMASYLVGEDLPADPYSDIAAETGLSRDVIKGVITKCIGAVHGGQTGITKLNASKPKRGRVPVSSRDFDAVLSAINTNYPWVAKESLLFNDVGTRMQYLEGEIAIRMMRWGVEEQVPLIPVHDAYAVRSRDHDKTYSRMLDVRAEVLSRAKAEKYLAASQYTVAIVRERNDAEKELKAVKAKAKKTK